MDKENRNKKTKDFPRIIATFITLGLMLTAFNHCVIEAPKAPTKSSARSVANLPSNDNQGSEGNQGNQDSQNDFVSDPLMPAPASGVTGMISLVSSTGKVTGYAGDQDNPTTILGINFYLDGPSGAGILLNSTPLAAGELGFNGGITGTHAFSYYIPSLYRDGEEYLLYAYAIDAETGEEVELQGSPYAFNAYIQTILGFNYYTNTVKPMLESRCTSCHAFTYDQNYAALISPSPAKGGTATNNEMINMPTGAHNGKTHPGGNLCGSKDNSPCLELQRWWDLEFN